MRGKTLVSGRDINPSEVRTLAKAGHTRKAVRENIKAWCDRQAVAA